MAHPNSFKQPLVSVGVPTYNRPDGLHRTLTCISEQSYGHLEIIISDNASSDPQVKAVIDKFIRRDSRISVIWNKKNIGPWNNFNQIPLKASGKYFMWAADDDLWEPDFIEFLVDKLEADPSLILAMTDSRYMLYEGFRLDYIPEAKQYFNPPSSRLLRLLNTFRTHPYNNIIYGLFRREVLTGNGRLIVFEDRKSGTATAALKIAERGPFKVFPGIRFYPTTYWEGYLKMSDWFGVKPTSMPPTSSATDKGKLIEKAVMFAMPRSYRAYKNNTTTALQKAMLKSAHRIIALTINNQWLLQPISVLYHLILTFSDTLAVVAKLRMPLLMKFAVIASSLIMSCATTLFSIYKVTMRNLRQFFFRKNELGRQHGLGG